MTIYINYIHKNANNFDQNVFCRIPLTAHMSKYGAYLN